MTDEELRDLVAATSRTVAENSRAILEMREDSGRRWEESQRRWEESQRRWEGSERRWEESDQRWERQWQESRAEILASRRETDRLITSLERRLGEIGNALGLYTESMFRPSLKRILRERFGMTVVIAPQRFQINGADYEIDIVGHAGETSDEVYLVEIKSQLREDGIHRLSRCPPRGRCRLAGGLWPKLRITCRVQHSENDSAPGFD
ncbi:MAG TPA: DUF3782 domain-containing protein [Thermoanaerobaculia bacterium]